MTESKKIENVYRKRDFCKEVCTELLPGEIKKAFNRKKNIFKHTIFSDNNFLIPKHTVSKLSNKGKKRIVYSGQRVHKISDLAILPEKEWRVYKPSSFLRLIESTEENCKFTQEEIKQFSELTRKAATDDITVEIATTDTWTEAYTTIRSCMATARNRPKVQIYVDRQEVFLPLIFRVGHKIRGRMVCVKYDFENYVLPIRLYTNSSQIKFKDNEDFLNFLQQNLKTLGYKMPEMFLDKDYYEDMYPWNPTHPLKREFNKFVLQTFDRFLKFDRELLRQINKYPEYPNKPPYLDICSTNNWIGLDLYRGTLDNPAFMHANLIKAYLRKKENNGQDKTN